MSLLALDTVADRCAVLVRVGGRDVLLDETLERGHDARLAPLVAAALAQAGVAPRALTRVAVVTGPGSFTGARVGVAFARGLALALKIDAVGVSALDALVRTADTRGGLVAVHDARRGELIARPYRDGAPAGEAALRTIAETAAAIDAWRGAETVALVGSGAGLLAGPGRRASGLARFSLAAVADLGAAAEPGGPSPEPFYPRPPDAAPARR
jgi:tRNA threonylcarbamoyladenosine biosynthesis protein TsaB